MIYLKNRKELEIMKKAGQIAKFAMDEVSKNIIPGEKTASLDRIAERLIESYGAESSFKKVENYNYTTCITPNELIVHGVPGDYILKEGNILGVDLGAYYNGFHSDMSTTFPVGKIAKETERFLMVGRKALKRAIKKVKVGNSIGDISETIQNEVESAGYFIVREFSGHGIGKDLHEDPLIPGFGKSGTGEKIQEGMVFAIEVIYSQRRSTIKLLPDGWSVSTSDSSLAGLFEHTVAATKKGPLVLTERLN
ncbi:MAG: type I methionyl aminopeptidase [Candidatus Woykebacteria bacterium RBG_13_40_15]|uniref:Methionine aminopeptidase n=1 Tax=Candidatus Woykebacteria bacterium RBG_13_40_15 TaxID=1802593 RepID=A0A1G1W995_9BACT|nr:MAG: type I methionyl aminopeptidase [Candidatus Woykebacteria bacterium RBG_13_40_15]